MLKKLAIGLLILVLGVIGVGFLLPSSYDVQRSIVIERSPEAIYPYLASLKKWQEWTPWTTERYPKMKTTYSGPEMGVGAKSAWTDPENGNGSSVITEADPEKGVRYDLFFEGFSKSEGRLLMEEMDGKTKVRMGMTGDLGANPVFRYFGLMMDSQMGKEFEQGLTKLKKTVESLPEKPPEPELAKTPFTADQIKHATKAGRTYKFRVEAPDEEPIVRTIQFTGVHDDKVVMKVTAGDGAPTTSETTWEHLVKHASYPKATTTISETEIETPAGKFDCMLYTVKSDEATTRAWFAKDLPGAPVRHEVDAGGAVTKMVLLEHVQPTD